MRLAQIAFWTSGRFSFAAFVSLDYAAAMTRHWYFLMLNKLLLILGLMMAGTSTAINAAVVLQYHHVDQNTPPSTSISPALFRQHLDYIADNEFKVWALPTLIAHLKGAKPIPDKVVVISFDDAYESIYRTAYPLLKERNWPFTIFVATQWVEQQPGSFMSWSQLQEMKEHGATIVNHTHSHAHLVRRESEESEITWLNRIRGEIELAQSLLKKKLSVDYRLFAYPYGEYTSEIQSLLSDMGYVAFGQQSGALGPDMDMLALPRFPMTNIYGAMTQFKLKVTSLPLAVERMEPDLKIIKGDDFRDGLSITFREYHPGINCFFSGKPLEIKQTGATVTIAQLPELPVGRSRLNCTAPSVEQGRYHWFSHAWMRPNADGSWYKEE